MSTPSVKQLEAFWWAATCSNFATAAQRVHLSVSSLSKRITELESALGQPLFDRSGHRAVLTDAGQRLLPAALEVLNAMAALGQALDTREALAGHCRFGVGDLSALTWLPAFVAAARQAHPQLVLEPHVDVGGVLEQRLDDGELDFAVIAGRSSRSSLLSRPVGAARFAWAVAPGLAGAGRLGATALLQRHALVTLPRRPAPRACWTTGCWPRAPACASASCATAGAPWPACCAPAWAWASCPPAGSPPWACAPSGAPIPRPLSPPALRLPMAARRRPRPDPGHAATGAGAGGFHGDAGVGGCRAMKANGSRRNTLDRVDAIQHASRSAHSRIKGRARL